MKSCSMDIAAVPPHSRGRHGSSRTGQAGADFGAAASGQGGARKAGGEATGAEEGGGRGGVGYGHMVISMGGERKDVFGPKKIWRRCKWDIIIIPRLKLDNFQKTIERDDLFLFKVVFIPQSCVVLFSERRSGKWQDATNITLKIGFNVKKRVFFGGGWGAYCGAVPCHAETFSINCIWYWYHFCVLLEGLITDYAAAKSLNKHLHFSHKEISLNRFLFFGSSQDVSCRHVNGMWGGGKGCRQSCCYLVEAFVRLGLVVTQKTWAICCI